MCTSLVVQMVKNLPVVWETWVRSLRWEDPLEEGIATHSSILAWRIPMDRGAWQAAVYGLHRADTTERLTLQDLLSAWQSKAFPCFFPFNSHNTIRIHISK